MDKLHTEHSRKFVAKPVQVIFEAFLNRLRNPSKGSFQLQANTNGAPFALIVADVFGRVRHSATYENALGDRDPIDLTDLPQGVYVVRLTSGAIDLKQKIIIAH